MNIALASLSFAILAFIQQTTIASPIDFTLYVNQGTKKHRIFSFVGGKELTWARTKEPKTANYEKDFMVKVVYQVPPVGAVPQPMEIDFAQNSVDICEGTLEASEKVNGHQDLIEKLVSNAQ